MPCAAVVISAAFAYLPPTLLRAGPDADTGSSRTSPAISMKAPARNFQLSDWYGADWDHKAPADDLWVSPWAKAHYKLRQQEIEIEQCEFMFKQAVEEGNYAEADGLNERVERLRSQHPIKPREKRLVEALEEENYALAKVFQNDLDAVKANLGLPKYNVGQAVMHSYRGGLRGVVMDVDLQCTMGRDWIIGAGCLERGCALGYPADETGYDELMRWANQPFYTVLVDLTDMQAEEAEGSSQWRWKWPSELAAWDINHFKGTPAPLYLPEEALTHDHDDTNTPQHPELEKTFDGFETSPHRGRQYRPSSRLRLWQQERQKQEQEKRQRRRSFDMTSKNPYDRMQ